MDELYFSNLEEIVKASLITATKSIHVAVAWINFTIYGPLFEKLLKKGVKIMILLNDDSNNQRYIENINYLIENGAAIKLASFSGTMHHKFCVIDEKFCMMGSFNWTNNANNKNIEDLRVCDDLSVTLQLLNEFYAIWNLDKTDIKNLDRPLYCSSCNGPIVYILFMESCEEKETKVDVMRLCDCESRIVFTDYYDISLYNNYLSVIHQFEDAIIEAKQTGNQNEYDQLIKRRDFEIVQYLSFVRINRMKVPIIHAIGVRAYELYNRHEGTSFYQIIWKERGTDAYIPDRYEI